MCGILASFNVEINDKTFKNAMYSLLRRGPDFDNTKLKVGYNLKCLPWVSVGPKSCPPAL